MSTSHLSRGERDSAVKQAPSAYAKLVHAEESEILSWAVKTALSDLRTAIGHMDTGTMRQDLRERKRIFLMLLNRLIDEWKRTGNS